MPLIEVCGEFSVAKLVKCNQLYFIKVKNSQDWKQGFDCRTLPFCLIFFSEIQLFGIVVSTVTTVHLA